MTKNIVFDIFGVLIDGDHGPIHESVDILMELKSRNIPLYAITNMSGEGFQSVRNEYPFLRLFDGIVVSGNIGLSKPDPAIFQHLLSQFGLDPADTIFIDDLSANVDGAISAGLQSFRFENPRQLEKTLIDMAILTFDDNEENATKCCGEGCTCH